MILNKLPSLSEPMFPLCKKKMYQLTLAEVSQGGPALATASLSLKQLLGFTPSFWAARFQLPMGCPVDGVCGTPANCLLKGDSNAGLTYAPVGRAPSVPAVEVQETGRRGQLGDCVLGGPRYGAASHTRGI